LNLPAGLFLTIAELEELAGCAVMINDPDTFSLKRVKHRLIEHQECLVFPQRRTFAVNSKSLGNYGQQIVAIFISKVPRPYLCSHVPSIEWSTGVEFSPRGKQHIRQGRESIPFQPEQLEPSMIRMLQSYLKNYTGGQLPYLQLIAALDDER